MLIMIIVLFLLFIFCFVLIDILRYIFRNL